VQTVGSFNFLSDQYVVFSAISGITMPHPTGDRSLIAASIRLQDLDMEALDSEQLSAIPPDLEPFLDNTGPNCDSDNVQLFLNLRTPFGAINSAVFRVTSLTFVPEPSGFLLSITGIALCATQRRR
jgi:hypothetical protein